MSWKEWPLWTRALTNILAMPILIPIIGFCLFLLGNNGWGDIYYFVYSLGIAAIWFIVSIVIYYKEKVQTSKQESEEISSLTPRYWLRGALTGLAIFVVLLVYFQSSLYAMSNPVSILWAFIAAGIPLSLVGAFIGWIYGKIKSRNNN